jgi:anaerobic selenocysteine-containing dehydrogenase
MVPRRSEVVRTPDRLVRLAPPALVADIPRLEAWVDAERAGGLVLIGRRHLRSNNSWMHNVPSLVKGPDRARLMMHPVDAAKLGLEDGAVVTVKSRTGSLDVALSLSPDLMPGVVSLPHGYGHASLAGATRVAAATPGPSVNALTDELFVEPLVGSSILNGVPVSVGPARRLGM